LRPEGREDLLGHVGGPVRGVDGEPEIALTIAVLAGSVLDYRILDQAPAGPGSAADSMVGLPGFEPATS